MTQSEVIALYTHLFNDFVFLNNDQTCSKLSALEVITETLNAMISNDMDGATLNMGDLQFDVFVLGDDDFGIRLISVDLLEDESEELESEKYYMN